MRKRWVIVLTGLTLLLTALCAGGAYGLHRVRRPHPPYPARLKTERGLEDIGPRLETAAAKAPHLMLDTLGQVRYGDFEAPIWRVRRPAGNAPEFRVLLAGGVHGSEPAGVESLVRFVEELAREPELWPGMAFDIVPLANPWGWTRDRRCNQRGYDLNRDFATFNTQEGRILRDLLAAERYDMLIEHHEDSSAEGFYLYQIANPYTTACRAVIEDLRNGGYPIEQNTWMVCFRTRDGVLYTPLWALRLARLGQGLSLGNYYRLTQTDRAFLFETPMRLPFEKRLEMQEKARSILLSRIRDMKGA
ncbi:MAG: DUF2817 domain-containing protein [Candidatus Hydrogenedentes bacterium]|nr:DUF2817 domain-containing protein [Candidatus Hydrogenedentota bacterium]